MIAFVRGVIEDISEDNVVLDTGGIGYNIRISSGCASSLPGLGAEIKLYTYTCVKEDQFSLFGFLSKEELQLFRLLITVNGIGPKGGLSILSVMNTQDLRFAIITGDAGAIARAPGIGKKTAERLIIDLKDKVAVDTEYSHHDESLSILTSLVDNRAKSEAIEALVALGYAQIDARNAVNKVEADENSDVEMILKAALKNLF